MFTLSNIIVVFRRKAFIRIFLTFIIMTFISAPGVMADGKKGSHAAKSDISCGNDSICKSIASNEFDLILYSSAGSEMVILFSESTVGQIVPKVSESYYSKAKGTVKDAIYYLGRHTDYRGVKLRKARKSKGFFRSQVIDGVYVALPEYESMSDSRPPEYSFSDKDGTLTVRIKAIVKMSGN